ncbi:MAG: hypothetical protein ACR2P4_10585, partial [Gammaproteobacteria bacterium]
MQKYNTARICRFGLVAAAAFVLAGCGEGGNFSQFEGFDDIRASLSPVPPNARERLLLARHKPRLFLSPLADVNNGPLDFYADYIAAGHLTTGEGMRIISPDAKTLNAHRNDARALFVHSPKKQSAMPAGYGGVYNAVLDLPGIGKTPLTFLSYHFVFRHSGLPAGVGGFLRDAANFAADAEDWHQLDHYTAVYIALHNEKPVAMILQQHNYLRSYLINDDESFVAGKPAAVDVALYSNELYPHRRKQTRHRAASVMTARTIGWLTQTGETSGGFFAAEDITEGARDVDYALRFLPPNDAFYVFEGYLGEKRFLPGRDGPPGAIYRTVPKLWHLEVALYTYYWKEGDAEYADLLRREG